MNYTKEQRAAMVAALKAAKEYLTTPEEAIRDAYPYKSNFICYALSRVEHMHPGAERMKEIIMKRLGSYSVVTDWLQDKLDIKLSYERKQEYRHLWVDELIREFSE